MVVTLNMFMNSTPASRSSHLLPASKLSFWAIIVKSRKSSTTEEITEQGEVLTASQHARGFRVQFFLQFVCQFCCDRS